MDDDDYFSDDFDSLPAGTLYELEQNAYQATQASQAPATQHQLQPVEHARFNTRVATPTEQSATLKLPPRLHTGLTNDYHTLEVGELGAEVHDDFGDHHVLHQDPHALVVPNEWSGPVNGGMDGGMGDDAMELDNYGQANAIQTNLRLEQLEQEKEQMRRELAEAQALAETKAGEIAIIRSKQTTLARDYDRQLAALRKAMADEAAKHKVEVEAAMSEGRKLATENTFLQHDLAEETYHLRNIRAKQQRLEDKEQPMTPRKSRVLPFRDGFDDDEIAVISPSKSATRSKRATPTNPGKRKRQASQDSPAPLQLSPAGEVIMADAPSEDIPGADSEDEHKFSRQDTRNEKHMKKLLSHRLVSSDETDIEAMAQFYFPSEPKGPLSRILLDALETLDRGSFAVDYIHAIAPIWQRAMKEKLFDPVPRFMAIVRYVLALDDIRLEDMIPPLVNVLQYSVEVNAAKRFEFSPARALRQSPQTPQSDLQPLVDSTECLRLLFQIACELLHVKKAMSTFWGHVRHDFILVMLHGSQPLKDISLTMHLLSTSIRPDSFGPIMPSEGEQAAVQRYIVDRLTHMLHESAQPDEGLEPYTVYDICAMRLEVLLCLEALAFNPAAPTRDHGSAILAVHQNALARLFRSMHDELDALYSSPPEQELRSALVNGLMRLIYGVMRRHGSSINMQDKLACVAGSKQKHLVVLTRLAFCDGVILEAGIEDETVDMAHELLEEWTNPQEAESLAEAFPSSRRD